MQRLPSSLTYCAAEMEQFLLHRSACFFFSQACMALIWSTVLPAETMTVLSSSSRGTPPSAREFQWAQSLRVHVPQPAGEATEARRLVLDISDALAVLAHANHKVGVVPRRSTHAAGCEGWQEAAACLPLSSLILERMGHGRMPPGVTVVARRWGGHVAILDQV